MHPRLSVSVAQLYRAFLIFQPVFCEDFIREHGLYSTLSTMLISQRKYNLHNHAIFNGYSFCIFATTCRPAVPGSSFTALALSDRSGKLCLYVHTSLMLVFTKRQHVSMCLVLDRKNFLDGAEIYGKNTRFMSRI